MSFITGIYAIDAPASALNNARGQDNVGQVKAIRVQRHEYPYVSAQAWRYWIRETVKQVEPEWRSAPIYRGKTARQQAFTEGDPITYWDDDLFGYMRAEKKEEGQKGGALTRVAPFRVSTLVSAAPVEIVRDFGVMGRDEGDYVLHEHEFYRAVLVGGFSLDLSMAGTFVSQDRTGYYNLDKAGIEAAKRAGLEYLPDRGAYRLPIEERMRRVSALLRAMARLQGGAKQTLHLTDVSASLCCMAVLSHGNNPFLNLVAPTPQPAIHFGALDEALTVYAEDFQSPVYFGLRQGFIDDARPALQARELTVLHPRQAFEKLANDLWSHAEWFA